MNCTQTRVNAFRTYSRTNKSACRLQQTRFHIPRAPFSSCKSIHVKRGFVISQAQGGREQWDFGRFVNTVLYFNPPPSLESALKGIFKPFLPQDDVKQLQHREGSFVIVTGATGGVGANVVESLLSNGKSVKAVVRDPEKAQRLLAGLSRTGGASLEIVQADITQPATLNINLFTGASAIISATSTIVGPKEGDSEDRQKYRQGVKFYEPEVKGASPREVEHQGLQNLLKAASHELRGDKVVFDPSAEDDVRDWGALDDVVMGGVSQSSFKRAESGAYAVFSGRVSETNNGGFASVRTKNFSPALDLGECSALRLRVKGDGLRYKVSVRTDTNWDGIGYTQSFDTSPDGWQDVKLAFDAFVPVFRAKTKPDAPPFNPGNICSIQLMLSKFEYDGKLNPRFRLGEFALPIERIEGVIGQPTASKFVHVSSAGVTRPGRKGLDLEKEPPAVRMNDALGGLLTWKLAGEDLIRESGIPYTIVRPVALTDEPAGADLEVAQGDEIKGKISRADVADLCATLISEPLAVNTTFEIKSTVPFSEQFQPRSETAKRNWYDVLGKGPLKADPVT